MSNNGNRTSMMLMERQVTKGPQTVIIMEGQVMNGSQMLTMIMEEQVVMGKNNGNGGVSSNGSQELMVMEGKTYSSKGLQVTLVMDWKVGNGLQVMGTLHTSTQASPTLLPCQNKAIKDVIRRLVSCLI